MPKHQAFLKVEKQIEEAMEIGGNKADLSNYGNAQQKLSELPNSLWQLTQLQDLISRITN